jgi:UDP:flavonoid glycosyltransferase YjiC (YdhE family)
VKVLVMTLGTRGDVQPFVALARALDAAGHEAVVCGPHRFEDFVVGHGIRFAGVDDVTRWSTSATARSLRVSRSLHRCTRRRWMPWPTCRFGSS